jgi:hypothetical protein
MKNGEAGFEMGVENGRKKSFRLPGDGWRMTFCCAGKESWEAGEHLL